MSIEQSEKQRIPLGLNLGIWDRLTSWKNALEIARFADELGYDYLMIPESFGRDGVTLCDRLLAATNNINVCFGIANVFSRSPAVLASTAATLDELSGGRFTLGLGGSTPNLVQGWHGMHFEAPLARTRETIAICRKIWSRDPSPFEGRFFNTGGVKLSFEPLRQNIPIWQGAVLERGLEVCGELADGWIPGNLPREGVAWGRALLEKSGTASGRVSGDVVVAPTFPLMIHEDPQKALPLAQFGLAMYYGQPGSPYARAASSLGYTEDVASVQAAYAEGGAEHAAAAVSERLAHSANIIGNLTACRRQIDDILQAGADIVFVTPPAPTRGECEPLLEGIIPDRFR